MAVESLGNFAIVAITARVFFKVAVNLFNLINMDCVATRCRNTQVRHIFSAFYCFNVIQKCIAPGVDGWLFRT